MKNASVVISLVGLIMSVAIVLIGGGKLLHTISCSQEAIQANTLAIQANVKAINELDTLDAVDFAEDTALMKANMEQHLEIKSAISDMGADIKVLLRRGLP